MGRHRVCSHVPFLFILTLPLKYSQLVARIQAWDRVHGARRRLQRIGPRSSLASVPAAPFLGCSLGHLVECLHFARDRRSSGIGTPSNARHEFVEMSDSEAKPPPMSESSDKTAVVLGPRPSGTVTFVFTDIEGSTRRWEADRIAMQDAVRRHDALLRAAINERGGYIFKTAGDAVCASFSGLPTR